MGKVTDFAADFVYLHLIFRNVYEQSEDMKKIFSAIIVTMLLAIPAVALSKKGKTAKANSLEVSLTISVSKAQALTSMPCGSRTKRVRW